MTPTTPSRHTLLTIATNTTNMPLVSRTRNLRKSASPEAENNPYPRLRRTRTWRPLPREGTLVQAQGPIRIRQLLMTKGLL